MVLPALARWKPGAGRSFYNPAGWRTTNPSSDDALLADQRSLPFERLWAAVSNHSPAICMYTWPEFAYSVIQ
jgi:hypothetical protein